MKRFLLLLFSIIWLASCRENTKIKPEYKPVVEAVYASGKILPLNDHKIFAMGDGVISAQYVSEGDRIRKGQELFSIESGSQQTRMGNAYEVYQQALQNAGSDSPIMRELINTLTIARARMDNDSANYRRYKNLFEQNATTRVEYDRITLAAKISTTDYLTQKERYEKLKSQLSLELKNAEAQYKLSRIDADNYLIKSQEAGEIYELYKKNGEAVRRNEAIAMVGDAGKYYLQLWIDEADVAKIKEGQELLAKTDLYKDRYFKATVTKIYPVLNMDRRSVRVDASFTDTIPRMIANATAEANIIISKKDKALTIPKTLLIGKDSVLVSLKGKDQQVKIVNGIETSEYVEIISGIDESTELLSK